MHDRFRFGILSTGNIARQFADGVAGSKRCAIAAVASRSAEKAHEFAESREIPKAYSSYDQLLENPDVDAVYNALPNHLHHDWTIKALEAGKHVLCEKPLSVTADEAQAMFDVAAKRERALIEAFMYRCHPQTLKIKELLTAGEIGTLKLIRASFCFAVKNTEGNIRFDADMAGGSLMDIGCYCVDLGQNLTGESPESWHVEKHTHSSGVDDYAAGTLRFPSGVLLSFTCGMTVQCDNAIHICGDGGYITVPWMWKPNPYESSMTLSGQVPPKQDPNQKARGDRVIDTTANQPLYGMEADHFAATVLDGQPPAKTAEQTIMTMTVLEQMLGE